MSTWEDEPHAIESRRLFVYDGQSGLLIRRCRQRRRLAGEVAGSIDARTPELKYLRVNVLGRLMRVHRIAWMLHYGSWPDGVIDHINGIGLDNRIANLRCVTHQKNCSNRKMNSDNSSGFKGVFWHKGCKRWTAKITVGGKQFHLGTFIDIKDAVRARKEAERKHGFTGRDSSR